MVDQILIAMHAARRKPAGNAESDGVRQRQRARSERFGQIVTADHLFKRDPQTLSYEDPDDVDDFNFDMPAGDQVALVILDDATGFWGFYTQRSKSKQDTLVSIRLYQGPGLSLIHITAPTRPY